LRRAARWDGLFPIDLPGPEALAELAAEVSAVRTEAGHDQRFDLIVDLPVDSDPDPWEAAGATWILTEFGVGARQQEVRAAIEAAPGRSEGR
jgi:hypothetical protein